MAQVQSRVLDLGQVMGIYAPFFQRQAEIQKANEERLITLGTLEDLVNSAPKESKTYKEYQQVMQDMLDYSADISRGMHVAGYNADKTVNLFRNYGKVTGRINRINKEIEESRTRRTTHLAAHPTAIFKQNNITDNIDDLADGKHINDEFTDGEAITRIMQTQAEAIGKALDNAAKYTPIDATKGYSVEVLQHGGIDPAILYDIWTKGHSDKCDELTNGLINQYLDNAKKAIGYDQFDQAGREQITNYALNSLTSMLREDKINALDSGEGERRRSDLEEKRINIAAGKHSGSGSSSRSRSGRSSRGSSSRGSSRGSGSSGSGSGNGGNGGNSGGHSGSSGERDLELD